MDYSYRNNRYKRRKTRQFRRLIAILAVSLTAGVLVAGYGLMNLFFEVKNKKNLKQESAISETSQIEIKGNSIPTVISDIENENKSSSEISESEVSTKEVSEDTIKEGEDKAPPKKKDLTQYSIKAAEKYYRDTAFIGDSRTQGLQLNAGIKSPKFFAGRGLNVKNALTEKVVNLPGKEALTVVEALEGKQYKKIYISFGINELGWPYPDIFIERYKDLISEIQKKQGKAEIVVYGVLPVTESKSDKDDIFNMKNVKKFNKFIKKMAKDIGITYVDLAPAVKNKKGFLPEEVTPDGIHMNKEYCRRILAYIVNKEI